MTVLPRLYAIADASFGDPVVQSQHLFEGGARLVQIRNKNAGSGEFLSQVQHILQAAPPDARLIVNDRVDIALLGKASGVHLGQDDLPVRSARDILGLPSLIGISTHSLDQALKADNEPADYIAVGPIFPTRSKINLDPVVGLDDLMAICKRVRKPIVAIGGITLNEANAVFECGVASIAVIRDILSASNIADRTREWLR